MFGNIELNRFEGSAKMPQKLASAWPEIFDELVGATYTPLLYLGKQPVHGTLHWFIAEYSQSYRFEIRHVIKMAILEKDGTFTFDKDSVTKII